jgi:hypothetical protein
MLAGSALFGIDRDDLAICLAVVATGLCMVGSGTRVMQWLLGARGRQAAWLHYPTLSTAWRYQLLLCLALCMYAGPDTFFAPGWDASAARWRMLFYATLHEGPLVLILILLANTFVKRRLARHRRPSTLELHGTVMDAAHLVGIEGTSNRSVEFALKTDDGVQWHVESEPAAHWASASLASGWPLRRVAPTHPASLPWGGLRAGDRAWLIGATEVPGATKRLVIRRGAGVLVRGGPAAAYTDFFALTVTFWFFMLSVQRPAWRAAVQLVYDGY